MTEETPKQDEKADAEEVEEQAVRPRFREDEGSEEQSDQDDDDQGEVEEQKRLSDIRLKANIAPLARPS